MPNQYIDFPERISDPGVPAVNTLRVYAKDDADRTVLIGENNAGETFEFGAAAGGDGAFDSVAVGATTGLGGAASGMFISASAEFSTQRSSGSLWRQWGTAGDSHPRFQMMFTGEMRWGPGGNPGNPVDTGILRNGVGILQVTDGTSGGFGELRVRNFRHGMNAAGATLGFFNVAAVARAAAMTQNYATANRTHAAATSAAVVTTGSALAGFGYITAAQADSIPAEINNLVADVVNLKQFVNAIVDDLQAYGLQQ